MGDECGVICIQRSYYVIMRSRQEESKTLNCFADNLLKKWHVIYLSIYLHQTYNRHNVSAVFSNPSPKERLHNILSVSLSLTIIKKLLSCKN